MSAKTKAAPTFLRSSQTERLVFPTKPSAEIRRSLRNSGFKWSGFYWYRSQSLTVPLKEKELAALLAPVVEQPVGGEPEAN